ncbi:MAG: ABC transporter ATP-binding protein [Candidatus Odinarchaeota archaeon]
MLVNKKGAREDFVNSGSNNVIIEADNVIKKYPNITALNNVSFSIHKNEIFCVIGPNGAGKSTIVKLLTGQIKLTQGSIKINNMDPISDRSKLVGIFGLVPQEIALYNELTGRENLTFHARLYNVPKYKIQKRVDEMLNIVGLTERQNDKVGTYSGGMKRRLQLVRALLHDPQIIILDEPTLGIDVQSRKAIHDYILELPKQGKTILLTTNYMEEAERLADRIIILDSSIIEGPGRLPDIQTKVFPNTIIEFKTTIDVINSEFFNDFLIKKLNWEIILEKQISEQHKLFQLIFNTSDLKEILEKFINYTNSHDISIEEFTIKRPTLEDIFLKLTGKEFRDNEN